MKSRPRSDEAGARRITLVLGCLALSAWACTGDEPAGPSTNPRVAAASASVAYTVRDLGTLGGPSSRASDINKAGIVVGLSTTASGATHAFRWQTGVMTDLGTLSGGGASAATAINRAGVIVGWSENRFGGTRAMQWSGDSKRSLGTLGGRHSRAEDINAWIGAHFVYDATRALQLSEAARAAAPQAPTVIDPEAFHAWSAAAIAKVAWRLAVMWVS